MGACTTVLLYTEHASQVQAGSLTTAACSHTHEVRPRAGKVLSLHLRTLNAQPITRDCTSDNTCTRFRAALVCVQALRALRIVLSV
jgi:hypothetical protein